MYWLRRMFLRARVPKTIPESLNEHLCWNRLCVSNIHLKQNDHYFAVNIFESTSANVSKCLNFDKDFNECVSKYLFDIEPDHLAHKYVFRI